MNSILPKEFTYTIEEELHKDQISAAYKVIAEHKKTYIEYPLIMKLILNPNKETIELLIKDQYLNGILKQSPDEFILDRNDALYNGAKVLLPRKKYTDITRYKSGVPISITNYYEKMLNNYLDELIISTPYNKENYTFVIERVIEIMILIFTTLKILHDNNYTYNGIKSGMIQGNYDFSAVILTGLTATINGDDYTPAQFTKYKKNDINDIIDIFSKFLGRFNSSTRNSKKTRLLKLLEKLPSYDIKTILLKLPKQTTR
jgi:hypothetical protein